MENNETEKVTNGMPRLNESATSEDAENRQNEGYEYTDWYFSKKEL